jgi:hypothetical protein
VIISPTPREWTKGSKALKKNSSEIWSHQRGIMIARRLSEVERELVPDKHDALDAVGLGLFGLGRLAAIRVNARPSAAKR